MRDRYEGLTLDGTATEEIHKLNSGGWRKRRRYKVLAAELRGWTNVRRREMAERHRLIKLLHEEGDEKAAKAEREKLKALKRRPMLRLGERVCAHCGGFFEPSTLRQKFCQDACRVASHRSGFTPG